MAAAHPGPPDPTPAGGRAAARKHVGRYLRGLAAALELLPDAVTLLDQAAVENILKVLYPTSNGGAARADRPAGLPSIRAITGWFNGTTVPNTTAGREALKALAYDLAVAHGSPPTPSDLEQLDQALAVGDTRRPTRPETPGRVERTPSPIRPAPAPIPRPITEWTPAELGVHLPLQPQDIPPQELSVTSRIATAAAPVGQTPYVPRAHDDHLKAAITDAITAGGPHLVLMIGGSSVGKTRACYQAVTHTPELAGWALAYPEYGSDLTALLRTGIPDRTIVWLTEAQRYLDDPTASRHLADLLTTTDTVTLTKRVLLLGSIWPENLNPYVPTDQDKRSGAEPGPAGRVLTSPRYQKVLTAKDFTDPRAQEALTTLIATDPVLAYAARAAGAGAQITQFLAGGPQLFEQYLRWSVSDDPADQDRAVLIRAAVDLYRAGYRQPHPETLLLQAAAGTAPHHGSPRTPKQLRRTFRAVLYQLADQAWKGSRTFTHTKTGQKRRWQLHDYLLQTAAHRHIYEHIPGPIWQAITAQPANTTPETVTTTALNHGLYHLAPHLPPISNSPAFDNSPRALQSLAAGNSWAADRLDSLLAHQLFDWGDEAGLRDLAATGSRFAAGRLAELLGERGDEVGLRDLAATGDFWAAGRLAELLGERGDEVGLRDLAATGDFQAAERLAELLGERGDEVGLRDLAATGSRFAAEQLAQLLGERGDEVGLRDLLAAGSRFVTEQLAQLLGERGDEVGLRDLAATGDFRAAGRLAQLLGERGDEVGLRDLAATGSDWAAERLAELLGERGDEVGLRDLAATGSDWAAERLAELLGERGDEVGLRDLAATEWPGAAGRLTQLFYQRGDKVGLRDLAATGSDWAAERLAQLLGERGDEAGLRNLAATGDLQAEWRLAELVGKWGDEAGLRDLAITGNPRAASLWAALLAGRGDEAGLRQLRNIGTTVAAADHLITMLGGAVDPPAGLTYDGTQLYTPGTP